MTITIKPEARKAISLGSLCAISYLAVYFSRNILSAVSPEIVEQNVFNNEQLGVFSSLFFITYAFGQLINGIVGDKIKAKHMLSFGLLLAGISSLLFVLVTDVLVLSYIAYALVGFFLSMIYAPMTKVVSENTTLIYAERCSLGYTFSSLFGSPLAGLAALFLPWEGGLILSGALLAVMGVVCLVLFRIFENKGYIKYHQYDRPVQEGGSFRVLFERRIVRFTVVSFVTGIVRTAVVFWFPIYLAQYLNYSTEASAMIFTVATLAISASAFLAIMVHALVKRNLILTEFIGFTCASVCFLLLFFIHIPWLNVVLLSLAILTSNMSAAAMWSIYCPSLRDTGVVSGATGFLDFVSYMAAAVSSSVFPHVVDLIGWNGLILVWFGLVTIGVLVTLPITKRKDTRQYVE